jgi:hypothetical protein
MLEMVKADLKSGALTVWGIWCDSSAGFAFAETDEVSLHAAILKWMPYIVFDNKPVLSVDQVLTNIRKAAAAVKKGTMILYDEGSGDGNVHHRVWEYTCHELRRV